jgi:hypothetical protein
MNTPEHGFDAQMDPWSIVPLVTGDRILFGFAVQHSRTGGLSWVRSTPIRYLDELVGRATTASGRRYKLGRRIELESIPNEGVEAWLAFDLLIGPDAEDGDAVLPVSVDRHQDAVWLAACKIARHLGVSAPDRAPAVVEEFVRTHIEPYFALRRLGRQN